MRGSRICGLADSVQVALPGGGAFAAVGERAAREVGIARPPRVGPHHQGGQRRQDEIPADVAHFPQGGIQLLAAVGHVLERRVPFAQQAGQFLVGDARVGLPDSLSQYLVDGTRERGQGNSRV